MARFIQAAAVVVTVIVVAGGAIAAQTGAWNWGADEFGGDDATKAICRRLGPPQIPAADRPTAAEAAALKGCSSEALYYGEGQAPDYRKARQCAIIEDEHGDDRFFGGKTILMQIYANGYGTARNIDLATALSCAVQGAPAENSGRVEHLQSLKTKPDTFDVCDDITSGFAGGQCTARAAVKTDLERAAKLDAVAKRMPAAARPAFNDVRKAFAPFVTSRSRGEIDLSGTLRGAFVVEEESRENDQFLLDLTRLVEGHWPAASHAEAVAADAALNVSYRAGLKACAAQDAGGTVTPDDIRTTQRAWLPYRDAYARFARLAAPAVTSDAILARLTRLRTAELDGLPCS